jgi:hypothetical protein
MLQKLASPRYNPQIRMTFPSFPKIELLGPANGPGRLGRASWGDLASHGEPAVFSSPAACGVDTDCEALSRGLPGIPGDRTET